MYIKIFAGKQLDFNILYRHSYVNNRRNWPLALLHPGMWDHFDMPSGGDLDCEDLVLHKEMG